MRHGKLGALLAPAFALLALLLSAAAASACTCGGEGAPCEAYGRASAVFVGTVTGVTEAKPTEGGEDYWLPRVYKFAVAQSYLGVRGAEVEVATGAGGGDCGFDFRRGETYLVYAGLGGTRNKRVLTTSICTRTRLAAHAAEDLAFLRGLASRAPGVSIRGTVFRQRHSVGQGGVRTTGGLGAATLTVEGEGVRRVVRTNAEGHYSLAGLKPGAYRIKLALPEELTAHQTEQGVALSPGGCATVNYYVKDNGRVSGTVYDAEGRPAAGIIVTLAEAGAHDPEHNWMMTERTDAEGRYTLSGVPPGRYVLAVNMTRYPAPGDPTSAFPRTYHPGVARVEEAEVINLGEGEGVAGRDLRLPPRRAESVVEGRVVWDDGTPVAEARISFRDVTTYETGLNLGAKADAAGRFTIKGHAGQTLRIEARSGRPYVGDPRRDGPMERAEPVRVTLTNPTEPVTITIRKLR